MIQAVETTFPVSLRAELMKVVVGSAKERSFAEQTTTFLRSWEIFVAWVESDRDTAPAPANLINDVVPSAGQPA